MDKRKRFDYLSSVSELKVRVYGHNYEDLFKNALLAMFESIEPEYDKENSYIKRDIKINAPDREILLIDFLSKALLFSDTHKEAYFDTTIHTLDEKHIDASVVGKKVQGFTIEIKAVTYHDVHIKKNNDTLQCDILFDI